MEFAANQQQSKTYTYKDMLKQPDCKEFFAAMLDEIAVHEERNCWSLVKRVDVPESHLVKGKVKTILSIWSFKQKRFPSGALMKHKVQLCAHGGMRKWDIDFWETYSLMVD
eukprot:11995942-Ditylum_brightwellii.AAC.1